MKGADHNPILITGIGGPSGRSAVTYFREQGFHIIGTDIRETETRVGTFYMVPPAGAPSFSTTLLEIIKKMRPSLLIPTVREELSAVSRLKRAIEEYGCMVFTSPPATIDIANDKLKTAMVMAGHGVPVPISFDECTPRELIIKELGFPILSKPRFGRCGRGVTLYKNREELLLEKRMGLIFQEVIPGEEYDVNLFRDKRGYTLAAVVLKKTILKDGIIGDALAVERVERNDIANLGIKVAHILNMEGPVGIDVRLREDGTPVVLEINARLGGHVLSAREILNSLLATWSIQ